MSKSKLCPYRNHCHSAGECENCDFGKAFEALGKKIERLKKKNNKLEYENRCLCNEIDNLRRRIFGDFGKE